MECRMNDKEKEYRVEKDIIGEIRRFKKVLIMAVSP